MKRFHNAHAGYSLVELMLAVAILAVVGSVSLAAFVGYNNNQALNLTTSSLQSVMQTARSRAASQVKPEGSSVCTSTNALQGYKVYICATSSSCDPTKGNDYELYVVCGSSGTGEYVSGGKFAQNVSVDTANVSVDTANTFFFKVLTGSIAMQNNSTAVSPVGAIHLKHSSISTKKKVSLDSVGNVSIIDE